MAKRMHRDRFADTGTLGGFFYCPLNPFLTVTAVEVTPTTTVGLSAEKIVGWLLCPDILLQSPYQMLRQRHKAVFASLTLNHMEHLSIEIQIAQIDSTPTVKDALTALNCMEYIEHLREIHLEFMELYDFERHKRSNRVQNENMIIKKELQIKIEDFFQNLYLAKKLNPNINYRRLENELNVEIQRVKTILAIRRAASNRRLEQRNKKAM